MIKTNYKDSNKNIFIVAKRPVVHSEILAKCTCGYEETRQYNNKKDKCPNCNSKIYKVITIPSRTNISQIYGYDFTKEKAIINYRNIEVIYRQDAEDSTKDSLMISEVKTDFIIEYETNKKGVKKFNPKRIVTTKDKQEEFKLLKSDLGYRYTKGDTDSDVLDALRAVSSSGEYNNLALIIWGIVNKYKHCYDSIQKGFMIGYDSDIASLKQWNEFVLKLPDNEIECLKKIYEEHSEGYSYSSSYNYIMRTYLTIKENFNDIDELSKFTDIKNYIYKNNEELRRIIPIDISRYNTELAELIYTYGFTIEEIGELFAHAERQAYNLSYEFNTFVKGCKAYKKLGLNIDKKPKELAIYITKMKAICDVSNFYGHKEFFIKNEDTIYNYFLRSNLITVKTVYENFGFKGLDILLTNHYMKKHIAYCLFLNHSTSKNKLLAVGFLDNYKNSQSSIANKDYLPTILLTLDGKIIDKEEDIKETLIELTKEAINKEETVC